MAHRPHPRWPSIVFAAVAISAFGAFMSFWAGCAYMVVSAVHHFYCAG